MRGASLRFAAISEHGRRWPTLAIRCPVARKRDLKRVDAVLAEFGVTGELALRFRDYIHELKESGDFGSGERGDFTMNELRDRMREFLEFQGRV